MANRQKSNGVMTLKQALAVAESGRFALGSFSPRYTPLIEAVLKAGQAADSPLIVQISEKELIRYGITPEEFGERFYERMAGLSITVPAVLHLDHTKSLDVIAAAIDAGFTSVMIDASEKPLADNIAVTREVVEYAHARGVSVEAELGMIGTTDFIETDKDEELYTDPAEAKQFVLATGVDALAVSCGTAHGVYAVRQPKIDFARLRAIRALTPVHLVLHGGSGVPAEMMGEAIRLPGGGVSKVNIATDLELSFLSAIGREERIANEACKALPDETLAKGREAVERTVADKIGAFLGSRGKAGLYAAK
ncbi:class II fructose-bisphosphate aldolase [Paenibacillus arenilitoris]|uniref:Class II fructose-bisphosphate aldolase n=1 Tax=Paenibacillus arenilitoris TaxID=2772299 RepID=A0A927CVY5_9BACL|nr:class II fructose-bisphosphate aldolase [Paenibacillus arenilitoris]MBD2872530.1 class II fructose-bisphosphate aldolase [Paenibacillus arenilitoris]